MIELLGLHIENILSLITQHNETNSNKLQKKFLSNMTAVEVGGLVIECTRVHLKLFLFSVNKVLSNLP